MSAIKTFRNSDFSSKVLQSLRIFHEFSKEEMQGIFKDHEIREFDKDEILHFQNESCEFMEIILEGRVGIQNIDRNGNVLTVEDFVLGEIIGANLLFSTNNKYPMTIKAEETKRTMKLTREELISLCHQSEGFMIHLFKEISDEAVILSGRISDISRKTIRESLMEYLQNEEIHQKTSRIKLSITKKELAERLGVARSSLGRELKKMKDEGLVEYDPWSIRILKKNGRLDKGL